MSNITPKFRLVQGRQIGERSSGPQTSTQLPSMVVSNNGQAQTIPHQLSPENKPSINQQMSITSPPSLDQTQLMHHPGSSSGNITQASISQQQPKQIHQQPLPQIHQQPQQQIHQPPQQQIHQQAQQQIHQQPQQQIHQQPQQQIHQQPQQQIHQQPQQQIHQKPQQQIHQKPQQQIHQQPQQQIHQQPQQQIHQQPQQQIHQQAQQQSQQQPPMSQMNQNPSGLTTQQPDQKSAVSKCVRFLKTLISLSNNPNQQANENSNNSAQVRQLIGNVIYGDISAEEFTSRLQTALNSQAQPHLLPFLQNTIPALRNAVRNGETSIEGISPPPGYVFNTVRHVASPHNITQQPSQLKSRLSVGPQPSHQMPPPRIPQPQVQMHQPLIQQPQVPQNQPTFNQQQPSTSHQVEIRHEEETSNTRSFTETTLKSAILSPQEIMNKITRRMMESCAVEEEALTLICDAAESHLRELITQIASIAEHRAESMRVPDHYIPIDDTKRQLRFLEDLDRQEEEVRESREKETIIRMSKNKNIGKETIEKAKEMQRVDAEAKRNRDANAAAIAALSSNRTVKNKWENASSGATAPQRPRTIRVTTRDLHLLVNTDNRFNGTFIREKLAYGGPSTDATI